VRKKGKKQVNTTKLEQEANKITAKGLEKQETVRKKEAQVTKQKPEQDKRKKKIGQERGTDNRTEKTSFVSVKQRQQGP
jgi:hypothetical protein